LPLYPVFDFAAAAGSRRVEVGRLLYWVALAMLGGALGRGRRWTSGFGAGVLGLDLLTAF
jgi:hypothetical protein